MSPRPSFLACRAAGAALAGLAMAAALPHAQRAAAADDAPSALSPPSLTSGPAAGRGAAGEAGTVAIAIGSISPDVAVPGKRITVSGWVRNGTKSAVSGLDVQLWSSSSPFTDRGQLDDPGSFQAVQQIGGAAAALPATLGAGQVVRWQTSFTASQVGMQTFGVYPLVASVLDVTGGQVATERTFLPYWPGRGALGQPLDIAWIWPLVDQPHQGICPALLDDALASSFAGGRLAGLLQTGLSYASRAKLTWVVDPALLDDANVMTRTYRVLYGPRCGQSTREPASAAAGAWLSGLRTVDATQPVFTTPYADPDVAALTHRGLDEDLRAAMRQGSAAAAGLPHVDTTIAWPPGGVADAGVIDNLLAADGSIKRGSPQGTIQTVVLDSSMMPPSDPALYYTPGAVTQVHTGLGTTVRVVLADHGITADLGAASAAGPAAGGSAAAALDAAGAATATSQRFLADTAMIAAEAPNLRRSVVVAPPRRWDPGTALASGLLADTVSAPWLHPTYLEGLRPTRTPAGVPAPDRRPLPAIQVSGDLTRSYLGQVRDLEADAGVFEGILGRDTPVYGLAIARLESSAWRGPGEQRGRYLASQAEAYLGYQERMVAIIPSSQVTLGGNRGTLPVSIGNSLPQPVHVRLQVTVAASRAVRAAQRLTVTLAGNGIITIGASQKETVRIQVRAHSEGLSEIRMRLLNPQGAPIPDSDRSLKVRSSAFGTLSAVIIGAGLGVLVLTFAARVVRRGIREGRPGTVVAEEDRADDGSVEAADELADARGAARPDPGG